MIELLYTTLALFVFIFPFFFLFKEFKPLKLGLIFFQFILSIILLSDNFYKDQSLYEDPNFNNIQSSGFKPIISLYKTFYENGSFENISFDTMNNSEFSESFEISVIYPSSRKDGQIEFAETVITTDSEGKASFLPDVPLFSFNSEVSFFPKGDMNDAEIAKIAAEHTIKAPYKVQTNLKSAGGTLAIVDFNQNGKAIISNPVSSSNLLMTLMKLGFTRIGNAPQDVSDAVIQENTEKVFARAKSIAPSFIVFGTVKIDSSEKNDDGTTYNLTGSVKAMDSKTGEITLAIEKTISVTDKNDWTALANARKQLADEIANEIKYGL